MINRKLLVEALRVDNKDVLPKFGSPELRKMLEAATEYIAFSSLVDPDDGSVTDEGIYAIMDLLERGSAGVADEEGQPALNFIKNGPEIIAHNMFTDEDEVIDATPEALKEYIGDQMEEPQMEARDTDDVVFKVDFDEYHNDFDVLAVYPTWKGYDPDDEAAFKVYSYLSDDPESYVSKFHLNYLPEAPACMYAPLLKKMEAAGRKPSSIMNKPSKVMFKKDFDDNVIAVFPNVIEQFEESQGNILTYDSEGVHTDRVLADDVDTMDNATPEEYQALKQELESYGGELQVMENESANEDATVDAENVIFKREPNEYTDETDILAVFPDIIEQPGDEGRILTYSHVGQHGYASFDYVEELDDATPEEYEPLKEELEGQGYVLNVLNGLQGDESVNEKELQNYGVCVAEDKGNDVEILGIKTGYHSFEEAQSVINDMETDFEFQDDPTMMLFVVYSDGTSWFNAVTGEEVPYEQNESVHEASNAFKTVREARSAVSRAKRVLQKELDKGNFKENFGRDKVRELKNRIPAYADDMDQDDLKKIQDIVSEFDEWCSTVTPKHEALEVKQYNKLGKDDYRNKTTEYSCNTMAEVRKIFKNSSELDKIDKVEVHQDGKLLYVGTPVAPSEDNKRWSFSWKKESLDDEAAVIIDEIHRKIVVAADSIKRSLTTKANFMDPNRVLNALDELNSLVDQDIEDLINSVDQRLD